MKHLRIINLLIVMLLLSAWVPAPQSFSSSPAAAMAFSGTFTLVSPASGYKAAALWPTFKWKFAATGGTTQGFRFQVSKSSTNFTDAGVLLFSEDAGPLTAVSGVYSYTPSNVFIYAGKMYWRVIAYTAGSESKNSSVRLFYTGPQQVATLTQPVSPSLPTVATIDSLRPEFKWDRPSDTTFPAASTTFTVEVATNSGFSPLLKSIPGVKENRLEYPLDLAKGVQFYWRVKSVANGLSSAAFAPAYATFATPAAVPAIPVLKTPLSAATAATFTPSLTWTGPVGANIVYRVQFSTTTTFSPGTVDYDSEVNGDIITQPPFTVPAGKLGSKTYYWRMQTVQTLPAPAVRSAWTKYFTLKMPATVIVRLYDLATTDPMPSVPVWIATSSAGCAPDKAPASPVKTDPNTGVATLAPVSPGTRYICSDIVGNTYMRVAKAVVITASKSYSWDTAKSPFNIPVVKPVIKLILTWSTIPHDLDSHLWLPEDQNVYDPNTGSNSGHIYPGIGQFGSTTLPPFAKLDKDAYGTASLKTETITIQTRFPGTYFYGVRLNWPTSTEPWYVTGKVRPRVMMTYNGKQVNLSGGPASDCTSTIAATKAACWLTVPAADGGNWWNVLAIKGDDGTVTVYNNLQTTAPGPYGQTDGTAIIK